jgi:hypothetical protein
MILPTNFKVNTHVVALFNVIAADTFNDDINVDEPEVTKSEKLVLFDNEVDVAFF